MNLTALDLNLVPVLRALLEERNVTRAGRRVGLSQPATSAALSRLRRHFDDELLSRTGNGYRLTPLGTTLLDRVSSAYDVLERLFDTHNRFDPAAADTEFTFTTSDYALAVIGEPLSRTIHAEAPGVRLRFHQITVPAVDDIAATLAGTDGLFMPHGFLADYPAVELYEDRWLCMVAADNATVGERLSQDDLARLPWVVLHHRPTDYTPALRQLTMLGVEPRIEVVVENFQSMPFLVAGTGRIALIQQRLARKIAPAAGVRLLECPFAAVPIKEAMWWHPTHRQDARHRWLREVVARVGAQVNAKGSADE